MLNEKYGFQKSDILSFDNIPFDGYDKKKTNARHFEEQTQSSLLSETSSDVGVQIYSRLEFSVTSITEQLSAFIENINENSIHFSKCVGKGAFGRVFLGEIEYIDSNMNTMKLNIAVKEMMNTSLDHFGCEETTLFKEMSIMKNIGDHVNIVTLIGYCKRGNQPDWLIMEYCSNGSLKSYLDQLREKNDYPCQAFQTFSHEIALGMEYLASKNIIHRDLAARNVLLSENFTCKISDFGMSRQLPDNENYYQHINGIIPLKWIAPEVLIQHKYSTQADVWSYGILLWEIYSVGSNPYEDVSMNRVIDLISQGYHMPIPENCPIHISDLIGQCWNYEARDRPTFKDIIQKYF